MDQERSSKPQGYKDNEKLGIKVEETPIQMVDRLLSKTGPVAQTITEFCDQRGLAEDSPQRVMLELAGAVLAAIGRRSQRKFPDSDPKELIQYEWESAFKAYRFVVNILQTLGRVDDHYFQAGYTGKPDWPDLKLKVIKRLEKMGVETLDNPQRRFLARSAIMLESYWCLENSMFMIVQLVDAGCEAYGVAKEDRRRLTDEIMTKHYPVLPGYDESRFPLAYEVRVLEEWNRLNDISC